ncbi:hypothetical protein DS901_11405 [Loktanella sp. D2R18]|uniref:hypothetical protein n=1 Tax=Rhodobacterales TaxID=204455 RepID=UPI000DE98209|nr:MULTISPECIES: hypothetical protein [Rhodobacterales]MDO6590349.1 hypothetical protein [Yoonia sp. 1_MG-2023]RBW42850.1 hypothetical protein DS901_11405 [Loktanella sp. D2R18]
MKTITASAAIIVAALAIGFGIYMVDVEQTQEASLPDVDVTIEGGNLPQYETELGDVELGTEEITLDVPTIDIQSPEEDVAEDR